MDIIQLNDPKEIKSFIETSDYQVTSYLYKIPQQFTEFDQLLEEAINQMTPVSKLIEQGLTPEGILNEILGEEHVQILETSPAQFECNCSHEKFLNAIKGLGEAEITDMIKEDHGAEAVCHFCGNKYNYSEAELNQLLESMA